MYPLPGAITTPGPEVVEDNAPRWQVVGQHPPGAPSAQHVADGVDDLPTRVGDRSAARFGRWQQWFQQLPFSVAEVAGIGWSFHAPTLRPTPLSRLYTSTPISTFLDTLLADYSYHGFITDREGDTRELEADHRRHAEIENAIRDLKYGVGLNHLPSGRFAANAAWLAVQVMAHNLARWTARIGVGQQVVTTKTLRRRFFSLAGRLTRSARRLTLHLPQRWHWETQFTHALARFRAIPLPACPA